MDFDFNWILVPATLLFFIIWLLDKLVWKRHSQIKQLKQQAVQADQAVQQAQQSFEALKAKYPQLKFSETVKADDEPQEIIQARDGLAQLKITAAKQHGELQQQKINPMISWAYDFWPVLAVVLVIRSFFYEPFTIPSESMNPTLETGDFILVNKYAYGLRLPLLNSKFISTGEPQHGDVMVFRYPQNPRISYIKRVIGKPGDHIVFNRGQLYINGQLQPSQQGHQVELTVKYRNAANQEQTVQVLAQQWIVTMGKHRFLTQYILPNQGSPTAQEFIQTFQQQLPLSLGQQWEVTVPQGQYFVMGDNRDQSADSRFWGFVPEQNLTGKATYLWMHKEAGLKIPSFSRNGLIP